MESTPSPLAKPGLLRPVASSVPDLARSGRLQAAGLFMETCPEAGGTRMRLKGSLTARTAMPFKQAVLHLSQQSRVLLVDLREVPRLDPTGLAALAEATELGLRQGCRVVMTNVPPAVRRLILQASLHKVIALGD